ncbi:MAG TPA: single-stranded-DNA-specific exonuclease RecJ [Bacteroidetes bacterium]|nr:single-stranded-DNA-specific exonuclease RecJ [Bacteroidota bacterium]HIL57885.1 single-stranded-DNA-specific exonuclease RecJ [Rhodothermales bacterium]
MESDGTSADAPATTAPPKTAPRLKKSEFRWTLRDVSSEDHVADIATQLNDLPVPLARALVLRGVDSFESARTFFRPEISRLHDPFAMRDMEQAADRVLQAIARNEHVMVYGDYDVDGTTSTAMLVRFFESLGVHASFFIPNRFKHGYGLSNDGLDEAAARGVTLVVAIDCGITALEEAAYARSLGIDLIICDHHTAGDELPDAAAVLDPKRPDCDYPFKGLSGCGVGYKLIQAVLDKLKRDPAEAHVYLDLVAVSTASDIVPMVGENRVLMREGLKRLCDAPRVGLAVLAERAGVDLSCCTSSKIVFQLGPRINAAGRIADASIAAELLASTDATHAQRLVDEIEELNRQRRELDRETRDEALAIAEELMQDDPVALVVYKQGWHPGVIGITASRVAEKFHRPTILLTSRDGVTAKGSARSVKGISVYRALSQCSDLLDRFGGHAFAAGLALPVENIEALRDRMQPAVESSIEEDTLIPEIELDAHLDLRDISTRFWRVLQQFGPHGPDNLRPVFWGRGLRIVGQPSRVGHEKQHLRFRVSQIDGGPTFPLIGFNLGERYETALASIRRGRPLEVAFQLDENTWKGRTSLQLRAKDLRLGQQT